MEALLTIFLPGERADTYRHKEMRSTDHLTYSVRFSWSCLAEPLSAVSYTAEVYERTNHNRNAAYSQQNPHIEILWTVGLKMKEKLKKISENERINEIAEIERLI